MMEMWSRNLKRLTQHMLFAILRYGNICHCSTLIFMSADSEWSCSGLNSQPSSIFTWRHGSYVSASRELIRNFSVFNSMSHEKRNSVSQSNHVLLSYINNFLIRRSRRYSRWRWIERVTCERRKVLWFLAGGDAFFSVVWWKRLQI